MTKDSVIIFRVSKEQKAEYEARATKFKMKLAPFIERKLAAPDELNATEEQLKDAFAKGRVEGWCAHSQLLADEKLEEQKYDTTTKAPASTASVDDKGKVTVDHIVEPNKKVVDTKKKIDEALKKQPITGDKLVISAAAMKELKKPVKPLPNVAKIQAESKAILEKGTVDTPKLHPITKRPFVCLLKKQ